MIWLRDVSKSYQPGFNVLDNVSLHIKRGEFVYVIGPSGAGKSTLLKLLFASERPTSGEVVVGGMNVGTLTSRDMPFFRRKVGVVFQDFKLLPRRTVFENVAFALEVVGRPRAEIDHRVEKILSEVGLLHCRNQLPTVLSGGEQQRVAIARAMVREPWLLIADEPTGNLDPWMAQDIFAMFKRANRRGTTVLIVTHALEEVRQQKNEIENRVLFLENGRFLEGNESEADSWTPLSLLLAPVEGEG